MLDASINLDNVSTPAFDGSYTREIQKKGKQKFLVKFSLCRCKYKQRQLLVKTFMIDVTCLLI